jgi:hypothetical protein
MDIIISGEITTDLHHVFEIDVKPFHDEKLCPALVYLKANGIYDHQNMQEMYLYGEIGIGEVE